MFMLDSRHEPKVTTAELCNLFHIRAIHNATRIEILFRSRFKFVCARIACRCAVSIPINRAGDIALVSRDAFAVRHQVNGRTSRCERVGQRETTGTIKRFEFGIGDDTALPAE
jgi:hypothetical protein